MLIFGKITTNHTTNFCLKMGNTTLEEVTQVKYLGVIFDMAKVGMAKVGKGKVGMGKVGIAKVGMGKVRYGKSRYGKSRYGKSRGMGKVLIWEKSGRGNVW